jgi:subtilisin family serine protease
MTRICLLFAAALLTATGLRASISPSLEAVMDSSVDPEIAVWVFFVDKGERSPREVEEAVRELMSVYPGRTVARRMAARAGRPFDVNDLPLHRPYVRQVAAAGVEIRAFSRWLNAVSVEATPDRIRALDRLDFVASMKPVGGRSGGPSPVTRKAPSPPPSLGFYGPSYRQLQQIQVPALHTEGYTGAGVVIAIFDTGFWTEHESLNGLNVIAEHDFINDDDETANEPGDTIHQHYHGTMCLSAMSGNTPGTLMGPAYAADIILAKTEDITMEQPVEEDYWIEAAEWADSLGAQVISSSLCYKNWYTYEDMDGETAPITIAADRAAVNGIAVVNAAGNSGASSWQYIAAPADGDSVISLGSVDSTGIRSYFSSKGPTYDGRIKPTVMAMGEDTWLADPSGASAYRRGDGTSFATPLAAGAIGLMLEKNPGWTSEDVLEAIMMTGTRAQNPDTLCGYGILQAHSASEYPLAGLAAGPVKAPVLRVYPNPCRTRFSVVPAESGSGGPARLYDARGRQLAVIPLRPDGITVFELEALSPRPAPGAVFLRGPDGSSRKIMILK